MGGCTYIVRYILFLPAKNACTFKVNLIHYFLAVTSRLSEIGQDVGTRLLDLYFVRERNSKREIKLLNMLLFVKSTLWKVLLQVYSYKNIIATVWQVYTLEILLLQ